MIPNRKVSASAFRCLLQEQELTVDIGHPIEHCQTKVSGSYNTFLPKVLGDIHGTRAYVLNP
jgi:hypothetical protein